MKTRLSRIFLLGFLNFFIGVVLIQVLLPPSSLAQIKPSSPPSQAAKHILLLYSYGHGSRGIGVFDDGFLSVMEAAGVKINDLFFEYLDLERNKEDSGYRSRLLDLLMRKYNQRKIDLIVTIQQPALSFLLNEGRRLVPGAPVITLQAPRPSDAEAAGRQFVSQQAQFDIKGTLERALELFPQTKRVVIVSGSSPADKKLANVAAGFENIFKNKLEFEYTFNLTIEQVLSRVADLPPHSIIIFTQYNLDAGGRVFVAYEVERMIIQAAKAPVFGLYDFNLRNGGIGGSVISVKGLGESTARMALDILNGKMRLTRPVTTVNNQVVPLFDWRQIQRWGGRADNLIPGSVIINRPPTMWDQYKLYVIGALFIIFILSSLIVLLMIQRRRRAKAERLLQQSEERFRQLVEQAPEAIAVYDADEDRLVEVNANAEKLFGCSREELLQKGLFYFYTPDQPNRPPLKESITQNIEQTLAGEEVVIERAIRNAQGQDLICEMRLVKLPSAEHRLIRNSIIDITERKRAEEQIITSLKEKEILLKEIHHRVKNNLTIIGSILSLQAPHLEDRKSREIFRECENRVKTMSKIHTKLYQSKDYAHIDFRSYLLELSQELFLSYQIDPEAVQFETKIDDVSLDINTALPLGLLLTELITNALKYAFPDGRKGLLQIHLRRVDDRMVLSVADDGIGFPEGLDYQNTTSLGLQLVMGLVRQLNGVIEMKREQGTNFIITFPAEE
jgi:PAS domain S-box-containing protein